MKTEDQGLDITAANERHPGPSPLGRPLYEHPGSAFPPHHHHLQVCRAHGEVPHRSGDDLCLWCISRSELRARQRRESRAA